MEVENTNSVETWDERNCNKDDKEGSVVFRVLKPKKLNGRGYKQLLKSRGKKAKGSDVSIEKKSQLSQSEVNVTEPNGPDKDEKVDADNSFSHSERESLDFLLRRVKAAGRAKRSNSSNHCTRTKKKKNYKSETPRNMDKPKLKKEFERCGEYMCKSTTPNFVEYWVPVGLSEMQSEQYCGTLFSNAGILCSCSKHDSTELLNDTLVSILVSTKKCCDHPYLVDGSLCTSLIRDIPRPELLDAEMKLSNKLLLLHKILLEIRKRGLRVLILYQSLGGSPSFSLGDILDEIIHQKFGRDISVRIGGRGRISPSKRQAALNTFNDKENGKFVCLMETGSCIPSVKLSSIDTVIFFNSDWNPMNDLKALQKIDLDSQFEHVKVFRLYSSHTLEENVLILAKQGTALEGNISDIKQSTCHQLLTSGTSYLFEKLDEFHDSNSIVSNEDALEDVFLDLSNLLPNNEKSSVSRNKNSLIVEVQQIGGIYSSNISLLGEVEKTLAMIHKESHVFWMELLEGRSPRWKYFSSQSRRTKKSVQRFEDLLEASAVKEPASKKCRTEAKNTVYQIPANIRRRARSKLQNQDRKRKFVPQQTAHIDTTVSLTFLNSEPPEVTHVKLQSVCKALETELEGLQKQKTELLKLHEEKKLQTKMACENEIDQIRKKYDMMLQNAETALLEEKESIEAKYNKVYGNKSLAEAVMQKDSAEKITFSQVTSNCSIEEMYQLFFQWTGSNTVTRPEQVAEILAGCSVAEGPNHDSPPERTAPMSDQHCGNSFPTLPNPATLSEVSSCLPIGQFIASGPNQPLSNQEMISSCMSLAPLVPIPQASGGLKISPIRPMSILPYNFSGNVPDRVRAPAPHLRHMRQPPPVTAPKMSSPGVGIFSPVSLRPVTSHVQTLQSTGPNLWAL